MEIIGSRPDKYLALVRVRSEIARKGSGVNVVGIVDPELTQHFQLEAPQVMCSGVFGFNNKRIAGTMVCEEVRRIGTRLAYDGTPLE